MVNMSLSLHSIWKKGDLRKGGDRSRWLNSPNVYQKVEVLETGTPDPKKITKVEIITFEDMQTTQQQTQKVSNLKEIEGN